MEIVLKIITFIICFNLSFWLAYILTCIIQAIYDHKKIYYRYRLIHFIIFFLLLLTSLYYLSYKLFFLEDKVIAQLGESKNALVLNADTWHYTYVNGKLYLVTEYNNNDLGQWKVYNRLDCDNISRETIVIPKDEKSTKNIEYRYNEYLDYSTVKVTPIQLPTFDFPTDGYRQNKR